ncbi:2OG-Fe(II) oxygenase, partial [Candidatus Pelagibacter sp.]|nr:2OG-Fe(II) oxygenase [Candidatus Pelagibacter sp.]
SNIISSKLDELKNKKKEQWNKIGLYHTNFFYIDDLLPEKITNEIYLNLMKVEHSLWHKRKSFRESKKEFVKLDKTNQILTNITESFQKQNVINKVEEITNLHNLESDPSLYAGGISMMDKNDFLNPHIDNSHDAKRERYRRLNLLFYVSPNWDEDLGGNLELWDNIVKKNITLVSKFNRLIVMKTDKLSWHSVSPVKADKPRCCVSNYYFSKNSPEEFHYYHVTSFNGRPEERFRRFYSSLDNFFRQRITDLTGVGRGKNLIRK